jgi:hypothetical protein
MHRACPGRFFKKTGCTLVLKNSKSSDVDLLEEGAGCWLSNFNSRNQQTNSVDTGPPHDC